MTRSVVIAPSVRTAIESFGGALAGHSPCQHVAAVARQAIARSRIAPSDIGQGVFGNVIHTAPKDMYPSRVVAIRVGVPQSAPALTPNRLCGSELQVVVTAEASILLGHADVLRAGGAESMGLAGHLLIQSRTGQKTGDAAALDMLLGALADLFGNGRVGITAENVADRDGIDRAAQDALALASHLRSARAIAEGRFRNQILPIAVRRGREEAVFHTDEHAGDEMTAEDLARLFPAFRKTGLVTAGNASWINDGAAPRVLVEREVAEAHGIVPIAHIVATGLDGVALEAMGLGPVPEWNRLCAAPELTVTDLDVIESNEAFAARACAVARRLGLPKPRNGIRNSCAPARPRPGSSHPPPRRTRA